MIPPSLEVIRHHASQHRCQPQAAHIVVICPTVHLIVCSTCNEAVFLCVDPRAVSR